MRTQTLAEGELPDISSELLIKNASLEDYQTQARTLSGAAVIVLKIFKVSGVVIGTHFVFTESM